MGRRPSWARCSQRRLNRVAEMVFEGRAMRNWRISKFHSLAGLRQLLGRASQTAGSLSTIARWLLCPVRISDHTFDGILHDFRQRQIAAFAEAIKPLKELNIDTHVELLCRRPSLGRTTLGYPVILGRRLHLPLRLVVEHKTVAAGEAPGPVRVLRPDPTRPPPSFDPIGRSW